MNSTPAAASTSNANAKNHTPFTHSFKIPSQSHRNYLTPASNADHSFYQSQPCHLPPPQTPLSHSTFPTSQFTPFSGLRNYTSDDEDEEQDEQDQNMDTEPVPFSWNGHPFKDESLLRRSQRSSMDGTQNLLKSLHSKLSFRPSTPMDPFSNVSEVVNPCAEPSQNPILEE
ncbi:hypothetical protein HMI56_000156 [Coelomomyces lativittatus]|nr:hypothetical protein HMI56_000156 [Coelomomyces lativittatus]